MFDRVGSPDRVDKLRRSWFCHDCGCLIEVWLQHSEAVRIHEQLEQRGGGGGKGPVCAVLGRVDRCRDKRPGSVVQVMTADGRAVGSFSEAVTNRSRPIQPTLFDVFRASRERPRLQIDPSGSISGFWPHLS